MRVSETVTHRHWLASSAMFGVPRRCVSGIVSPENGDCMFCLAANGEVCHSPAVTEREGQDK